MFGKRKDKRILLLMALCAAALIVTGCGSKESMTEKTFKAITEDTGVHMEVEQLTDGARNKITIVRKGDNLYANVPAGGSQVIVISDGKTLTTLDPATKSMTRQEITEDLKKELDNIASGTDAIMAAGEKVGGDYEEGTVRYDGEEYTTEIYKDGDDEAVFGYKDGKLGYFAVTKDGQKQVLKINAMDGDVDEALFVVPEGYTEAKPDSNPEPSAGSDTSGSKGGKSIDAVGAAVGSAGTGTPTGDDVTVNNDEGGYAFEMDKAFSSENQGAHSYVFTEKDKKVPHFDVEPVSFGGDVDKYFDTLITNLNDDSGTEMITAPVRTQLKAGNVTLQGIEYVIQSGDSQMVCMFYIYPAKGKYYKFAGFYIKDDMTTPTALQHAIETFRTA